MYAYRLSRMTTSCCSSEIDRRHTVCELSPSVRVCVMLGGPRRRLAPLSRADAAWLDSSCMLRIGYLAVPLAFLAVAGVLLWAFGVVAGAHARNHAPLPRRLSIVVPTFREADNIEPLADRVFKCVTRPRLSGSICGGALVRSHTITLIPTRSHASSHHHSCPMYDSLTCILTSSLLSHVRLVDMHPHIVTLIIRLSRSHASSHHHSCPMYDSLTCILTSSLLSHV
jgi:hypothetical protein